MNIETFDPKEAKWPDPDPDFKMCMEHQPTMVTYRSAECPLCSAEARVEELEQANLGADVRVARMEAKLIAAEKYIKYIEAELES